MRLCGFETFLDFLRNTLQICLLSQFACERKNSAIHFFWKLNSLWFFHRKFFYRHIKNFRNSGKPQSISSVCFVKYPMRTRVPIQRYFFLKESRIKFSYFLKFFEKINGYLLGKCRLCSANKSQNATAFDAGASAAKKISLPSWKLR